jgi:hypothetical protein
MHSPELIDHLVTFNPFQFLTGADCGGGVTEILGVLPGGFWPAHAIGVADGPGRAV